MDPSNATKYQAPKVRKKISRTKDTAFGCVDSEDVSDCDSIVVDRDANDDQDRLGRKYQPSHFKRTRALFSPFGADSDIVVVGYVLYEFASRVSIFNFNVLSPLLIAELGDQAFLGNKGKVIWGYVAATAAILTVLVYLSLTPIIEFGNMKRDTLINSSIFCAIMHILYIFCFFKEAIYLAVPLMIVAKVALRVSDVAFNALLDVVASGKDPHQISSRCNITGYIGMLTFLCFAAPTMWIINVGFNPSKLLIQGTIPVFFIGLWYFVFIKTIDSMLPTILGDGLPVPKELGTGVFSCLCGGFKVGIREQIGNLAYVIKFKDLSLFIVSFIFLQGGANTAVSVAAIFTVDVLHLPVKYVAGSMLIGLASAILGLGFYKSLCTLGVLNAKQVLLINMTLLGFGMIFALYVNSVSDIYILAVVCGSQIGTVGAYSRSIISSLVPKTRQSRLFSFYEFTQDGTHWIGPVMISALTTMYGDAYYRNFVVIVCLVELMIGIPILACVDIARGEGARALADSFDESALGLDMISYKSDTEG